MQAHNRNDRNCSEEKNFEDVKMAMMICMMQSGQSF